MRFGLVHRIMLDALAALGVLAIVSSASMSPAMSVLAIAGTVLAIALSDTLQQKPQMRYLASGGPLLLFLISLSRLLSGQPALDVAIELATFAQILRLLTRRGAAHDQQIIVLALLHFVVGTVLGGGLAFGICFLGFMLVAPGALVLSHLRREVEGNYRQGARDRTGLPVDVPRILRSRRVVGRGFLAATSALSVPIFLLTAIIFLLFPRVGLSLLLVNHNRAGRMIGFSDHVDLGNVGVLRTDPTIALRFEVKGQPEPRPSRLTLRLRGTAFDTYDGRAWSRSSTERKPEPQSHASYIIAREPKPQDLRISFEVEPIDPPVLFFPPRAVAFQVKKVSERSNAEPSAILRGSELEFRYGNGQEPRGIRYEVAVAPDDEPLIATQLSADERLRYLRLPHVFNSRIASAASEWTREGESPLARAKLIEQRLAHDYGYDTNSPSGGTAEPVDDFLFVSRRGHCEFFSTAMALMLRTQGIPSRNVTGFVGGTYNRFGQYYAVREGDAHSWVEAFIETEPGRGAWMTFDPTPTAAAQPLEDNTGLWPYVRDLFEALSQRWTRYVVGYDLRTQTHLLQGARDGYENFRARQGMTEGIVGAVTRPRNLAALAAASAVVAYVLWRKRRTPQTKSEERKSKSDPDPSGQLATRLYNTLESALASHGLSRPSATPPLRYAEQLARKGHPFADEVADLTEIYLRTRFGRAPLAEADAASFAARVAQIKKTKLEPPPSSKSP